MIRAGATPKLITSARESSSLPISEYAFSSLAELPSRKSNIIAANISQDDMRRFPSRAYSIAINPAARFRIVIKLGICFIANRNYQEEGKNKINFSNNAFLVKFGS